MESSLELKINFNKMEKLNIGENFIQDESIESYEYREYTSDVRDFNKSGEIRFTINQQDVFLDISESYLLFKGQLVKSNKSEFTTTDKTTLINNALMYLFSNIRYRVSGQEIENLNYPGETTTMIGYLKYNDDFEKTVGLNQLWFKESNVYAKNRFDIRKLYIIDQPNKKGSFSFCVPLKHIFGFCETYSQVMYGYQHELSLYRKQDSKDAVVSKLEKTVNEVKIPYLKMSDAGKVKLDSLTWFVPHVKPSLEYENKLLKTVRDKSKYQIAYKKIQDQNTIITSGTSYDWRLSTKTSPEKPRFIIIGFQLQTPEANEQFDKSLFINADVRNIFVTLNSRRYPEVDYQLDFGNNDFSRMFLEAINFKQKCFMDSTSPNLSSFDYKEYYPLYVIDVSNQSDSIKGQVTDITVKINFNSNITKPLQVYAVVVSDRIVETESDGSKFRVLQ